MDLIEVERGFFNTIPIAYTAVLNVWVLSSNIGNLTGVSGWQSAYEGNHIGQNPGIVYVANAAAVGDFELVLDSSAKTLTLANDVVNNLGGADDLEDIIANKDIIKIIASNGTKIVNVDYISSNGIITYSDTTVSASLTSGAYFIDCNKVANGNFRCYLANTSPNKPDAWTFDEDFVDSYTTAASTGYSRDTLGKYLLSLKGGLSGREASEYNTSSITYDLVTADNETDSSPFLLLINQE